MLTGLGVLAGVAAGVLPVGYIMFRDDALVCALRGWTLVLPWSRIRAVEGGEFAGNPAFFLWFDDAATMPVPPARQRAFLRQVALCRDLSQSDYYLPTASYAISLPTLVAAIEHRIKPASSHRFAHSDN